MIDEICRNLTPIEHYGLIILFNFLLLFVNEIVSRSKKLIPHSLLELIKKFILRQPITVAQVITQQEINMKEFAKFEKEIGGDGGKASGSVGIEAGNITAMVKVSYPAVKVLDPVLKTVDSLVDKLEKLIPGDQLALAEKAKLEYREALAKELAEIK